MLEKELESIVLNEKDIIPFLKKLTPQDKRALVPFLKKFREKIFERYDVIKKTEWGTTSYTTKPVHSDLKRSLVDKACYVCFNKTDAKRVFFNVSNLSISDEYLAEIIPWYTPKWYGDLINENMPWELKYEKMMVLYKKGLFEPSQSLITALLPNAIIEVKWENKKHTRLHKPEVLHQHKETLDQHIWLLFEEESGINNHYEYSNLNNRKGGNDLWIDTITQLVEQNQIDRKKTLIATIYTATKGFNKSLSGWFFDLLINLNPSIEEVFDLQDELFSALNSPHSKVQNTVLKYFKLIANQKKFKHAVFIDNASILLNAETKSVVNSTLMVLEKIAKTRKSASDRACVKAAEALINTDEKIQLRAAKLIAKYGSTKDEALLDEVSLNATNIFHSSKEVLTEFIQSEELEHADEMIEEEAAELLSDENLIPVFESFDDLVFFISQSIDNNEVFHLDLLLTYLPKLNVLIKPDNVSKLEPIFKRSLDLSMDLYGSRSHIGILELEAAFFINDYAEILLKKYPLELQNFRNTKNEKIEKLKRDGVLDEHYQARLKEIESQGIPDNIYRVHHSLFIKSKNLIKKDRNLDLLSKPTHAPCWIDPVVLIDRIIQYGKFEEDINLMDFQIALGRLPTNSDIPDIIEHIKKIEDSELRQIFMFHHDLLGLDQVIIKRPELWLPSLISRKKDVEIKFFQKYLANPLNKERGVYEWDCILQDYYYDQYDYEKNKKVKKKVVRNELTLKDFNTLKTEPESIISGLKRIFTGGRKTKIVNSFYSRMYFKKRKYYTTIQPHDDVKFMFLAPNNSSMFLSHVLHHNLKESTFLDESGKKNMINLLKGLYELWQSPDMGESTYLFLATGMLCSDKVSRELAAEIWIKTIGENSIDNTLLGGILGKLESKEYAPLKRFTDLLTASLFNISKKHNEALFTLLDEMIGRLKNSHLRGLKKLLELFLELKRSFPTREISDSTKNNISEWKDSKTLKPVIAKLEVN